MSADDDKVIAGFTDSSHLIPSDLRDAYGVAGGPDCGLEPHTPHTIPRGVSTSYETRVLTPRMQPLRAVRLVVDRSIGGGQTHRVLMMSDCTEMMVVWLFFDSGSKRTLTVWLRWEGGYERFLGMARENKDRVVENNWDESSLAPRNSLVSINKSQFRFAGGISGGAKTPAELAFFKELDGLVAVSKAVQKYAKQHCDLDAEMIPNHAWSYKDKDTGDWPRFRKNFAKQNVVMINPA